MLFMQMKHGLNPPLFIDIIASFDAALLKTSMSYQKRKVKQLKIDFNYKKEIKWSNISIQNIDLYNEILVVLEDFIRDKSETKYRQLFMDRAYTYAGPQHSELEGQFKILLSILT